MKGNKRKPSLDIEISNPARSGLQFSQCLVSSHKKKKKQIDTRFCQESSCYEYPKVFNRSFSESDDSYSVIPEDEFLSDAQKRHGFRINNNGFSSHLQDTCDHVCKSLIPNFPCMQSSAISSRDIIVELPSRKYVCPSHLYSDTAYLPMTNSYASKSHIDMYPQNLSSSLSSGLADANTDFGNYYDQTIYDSYIPSIQATIYDMPREFYMEEAIPSSSQYKETEPYPREFLFEDDFDMKMELDDTIPLKNCDYKKLRRMRLARHDRMRQQATDLKKMQKSESMHCRKTSVFSRLSNTKNVKQAEQGLVTTDGDFTVKKSGDFSVNHQTMFRVTKQQNKSEKINNDVLVNDIMFNVSKQKYKSEDKDGAFSVGQIRVIDAKQKYKLVEGSDAKLKDKSVFCAVNQKNNMEKTDCDLLVDQSKHCVAKKKYKLQNTDVFSPNPSMSPVVKQKNKLKRVEKYGSLAEQVIFSDQLERSEGFNFKRRSKMQKVNEGQVCTDGCFSGKQQKRKLTRPSFENDGSKDEKSIVGGSSGKQKRRKITRPSFGSVSYENDSSMNQDGQLMTDHILVPEISIHHVCQIKDENTITRIEDTKSIKHDGEKTGVEKNENANNRINKFWARNVLLGAETYAGHVYENDDRIINCKNQDIQVMDSLFHKVDSGTKMEKDENSKKSNQSCHSIDQLILGMQGSLSNEDSESGSVKVCVNKDININSRNQDGQSRDQHDLEMKRPFLDIICAETDLDQVYLNKDESVNRQLIDQHILAKKCPFHHIACAETGIDHLCNTKDKYANNHNQNGHSFDQQFFGSCQICENNDGKSNIRNQDGRLMCQQVLGKRATKDIKNCQVCEESNLDSTRKNQDGQLVSRHIFLQRWANHGSANITSSQVGNCYIDRANTNNSVTEGFSQKPSVKETSKIFKKFKDQSEEKFAIVLSCKQDGFPCEMLEGVLRCDETLEEGEFRRCDQTLEECEPLEEFLPLHSSTQGFIENDNEITARGYSGDNIKSLLPLGCIDLPDFHCNLVDMCDTSSYVVDADPTVGISSKNLIKEELDYFRAQKSIWKFAGRPGLSIELNPPYRGHDVDHPSVSVGCQKEVKVEKGLEIDLNSDFLGTEVLVKGDCVGEVENSWQCIKGASPLN